jgi:hypothetical protein
MQGLKGLPGTSTLAYLAYLEVTKKMQLCEYVPWAVFGIYNTSISFQLTNEPNRRLERPARDEHSNIFVSCKENEAL